MHSGRAASLTLQVSTRRQTPPARHRGRQPGPAGISGGLSSASGAPGRRVWGVGHTQGTSHLWKGGPYHVIRETRGGNARCSWPAVGPPGGSGGPGRGSRKHEPEARRSVLFSFCGLTPPLGSPHPHSQVWGLSRKDPRVVGRGAQTGSGTGLRPGRGIRGKRTSCWRCHPLCGRDHHLPGDRCVEPQTEDRKPTVTGRMRETVSGDITYCARTSGLVLCPSHRRLPAARQVRAGCAARGVPAGPWDGRHRLLGSWAVVAGPEPQKRPTLDELPLAHCAKFNQWEARTSPGSLHEFTGRARGYTRCALRML